MKYIPQLSEVNTAGLLTQMIQRGRCKHCSIRGTPRHASAHVSAPISHISTENTLQKHNVRISREEIQLLAEYGERSVKMWGSIVAVVLVAEICAGAKSAKPAKHAPADFAELKKLTEKHFAKGKLAFAQVANRPGSSLDTWECERITSVPSHVRSQLRLSTFYRKYLHAFGIPVVSSNAPSDAALRRACYIVVFLLADRKDIRDWLFKRNGRAGVVGLREGVTTIPEHSWLPAWWNQRARGLGGTIGNPISTCGEENIMCSAGDRYPREDIFLHEFTHGIHEIAIAKNGAIPNFDARLNPRYRYLKSSGRLWARTYAMSTDREYFAEGTQSYFDVNDYQNPTNGIHNHVNTRAKLRTYDPVLYNFDREVFPCGNRVVKRCEAKGNVPRERYYFKMNCDKNGNGILMDFKTKRPVGGGQTTISPPTPPPPVTQDPGTEAPTPPRPNTPPPVTNIPTPPPPVTPPPVTQPPVTRPPVNCVDSHRSCAYWARTGECNRNPVYMKLTCKKSCQLCSGGGGGSNCRDNNPRCSTWAQRGECRRNPAYMLPNCKRSCNNCTRRKWGK